VTLHFLSQLWWLAEETRCKIDKSESPEHGEQNAQFGFVWNGQRRGTNG
jgi:hypothetical protein